MDEPAKQVFHTIGHSNRSADSLIQDLAQHHISLLVDIRAFPRSRRFPHFNRQILEASLAGVRINYRWFGDLLGGFRKPRRNSPHTALEDAAFRGFADYMDHAAFTQALTLLSELAGQHKLVLMCAEADHQHCHRQFIADALTQNGHEVLHINSGGGLVAHHLHACLDVSSGARVYNKHIQGDLFL